MQVHADMERISLGIKQLEDDPFNNYVSMHRRGSVVKGKVTSVDAKGAVVELADGVEGYIRASDVSQERVEDATTVLSKDQEVEPSSWALTARTARFPSPSVPRTRLMTRLPLSLSTAASPRLPLRTQWLRPSRTHRRLSNQQSDVLN